jgi:cellulose/xylan binding protein with CBM9 domain
MRKLFGFIVLAALVAAPVISFAQGTNSGATITAPFVGNAPVIDGTISDGEWATVGVAEGTWTSHDSDVAATFATTVKVCYSVDAVYFLYECEDDLVESLATGTERLQGMVDVDGQLDGTFPWGGETDYVSLYVDPSNYADDAPNADEFSYSIQWEPSITAKDEKDAAGNSFHYTESGRWGGFRALLNPPVVDTNGATHFWAGGPAWDGKGIEIVDAATADGFICEVKIPWASFNGYWRRSMESGVDLGDNFWEILVNGGDTDPYTSEYGAMRVLNVAEDGTAAPVGSGVVTGMPMEGDAWKVQFCRFSNGALGYVNWVGDTGGFVSRPFGNLVFGPASGSEVENAMLH